MKDPGVTPPKPETLTTTGKPSNEQADALLGTLFDRRYQILAKYGSGAAGTAYKAQDSVLDRTVAIKIMHSHLLLNERAVERFKAEAATCTLLSHPNIVKVYTQGVAPDGRLYLVMDCLEGKSLADLISENGKVSLDIFFEIFAQVIEALKYAHEQNVIHRDIKPSNIMLVQQANGFKAYVVDFGIAKCVDQNSEQGSTQTGAMLGSSAYMSPEQCKGTTIDFRADIYSLGCVMVESLMGESPFKGQSALDMMYQHLNESLSKLGFLKELPEPVSQMLRKCLQKEPQNRFENIGEMQKAFAACSDMKDTLERKWSRHRSKDNRLAKVSRITTIVLLGAAVIVGLKSLQQQQQQQQTNKPPTDTLDPEISNIPRPLKDLNEIASNYIMPEKRLRIYERWLDMRGPQAARRDLAYVYSQMVKINSVLGNFAKAREETLAIKALAQEMKASDDAINENGCSLVCSMMDAYIAIDEPLEGVKTAEAILRKYPQLMDNTSNAFDIWYKEAQCFDKAGDLQSTTNYLQKACKKAREDDLYYQQNVARTLLITCLCKQGKTDETKPFIDDCLKALTDPEAQRYIAGNYYSIGEALVNGGAFKQSIEWLKKACELELEKSHRISMQTTQCLVAAYRGIGRYDLAEETGKEALKTSTSWIDRLNLLCNIALDSDHTSDKINSLNYAKQALDLARANLTADSPIGVQLTFLSAIARACPERS